LAGGNVAEVLGARVIFHVDAQFFVNELVLAGQRHVAAVTGKGIADILGAGIQVFAGDLDVLDSFHFIAVVRCAEIVVFQRVLYVLAIACQQVTFIFGAGVFIGTRLGRIRAFASLPIT